MRLTSFFIILTLPCTVSAGILSCEHKQTLCKAECRITNPADDTGVKSCNAQCLGERASCSLDSGMNSAKEMARKAIEAGKLSRDEAKAFMDGFNKK